MPDREFESATEYNILGKISVERFHNDLKCSKSFLGDSWIGACPICVQYASLWKEDRRKEAQQLKPVERHTFACSGSEPLMCGKFLALLIGNGSGKFLVVKYRVYSGFGEDRRVFSDYNDSHFVVK